MSEPLCIKIDGAWTVIPYGQAVTNMAGIQASYETLLLWSREEQEAFGVFRPAEPDPPSPGQVEVSRDLGGDERPVWRVTYADAPAPAVPESVQDWQFAWQAAEEGIITRDEALAWSARGEVPASLKAAVDGAITDPGEHFGVMMLLVGAKTYERHNPLVPLLGAVFKLDAAGLDQFWRAASTRGVAAKAA